MCVCVCQEREREREREKERERERERFQHVSKVMKVTDYEEVIVLLCSTSSLSNMFSVECVLYRICVLQADYEEVTVLLCSTSSL
jgi:hypothetical protein